MLLEQRQKAEEECVLTAEVDDQASHASWRSHSFRF